MIPKVVGYQGFQSYGDLPYPSLKAGKRTLDSNTVWQQTVREEDKESLYKNSNYHYSNKTAQMDSKAHPDNFKNVQIVKKGNHESVTSSDFFKNTGNEMLKTGVDHWQSNYQASIVDPYAKNTATRPEWSLYKPPYQVQTQVGPTEYKKHFGQLGQNPRDKLEQIDDANPRVFDVLRLGTTQNSFHPPGYTGFIPAAITKSKAVEHGVGAVERKEFMKTNLKENYHTKIPGYAGHVPQAVQNQRDEPRASCFGE